MKEKNAAQTSQISAKQNILDDNTAIWIEFLTNEISQWAGPPNTTTE